MSAIDLNLLRIFDVLMEEQNVTRAGARLGLSQSAVSHALSRLRHHFGDPLFVRRPEGMAPTARAFEIGPGVHAALSQLQTVILPSRFEPALAETRLTIAAGAYGCAVLIPQLAARLAEQAPRIEIAVTQPGPNVLEQLDDRRADFALWSHDQVSERILSVPLTTDRIVWAVRAGHPTLGPGATLEQLADTRLAAVIVKAEEGEGRRRQGADVSWKGMRPYEEALAARGLRPRIGVRVPDVHSAITVVARSDMATMIPRRLGLMSERMGILTLIEPPHPAPDVRIGLLVLRERAKEPALAWMHAQLADIGREL
jgi:DNA-binding transcriptional LysR family regulator